MLRASIALLFVLFCMPVLAQNSTRKLRVEPSPLAARAGSGIAWHDSFETALAAARAAGKPLFWYVPTVAGSPMDRQPEIDRYMLAGPFSWPSTISLLRDHCVALRLAPSGELQKRFELVRGKFVEPGYLLLDADGKELDRVHSLTTFHPQWFEAPLRRRFGLPTETFPCTEALQDAWAAYRTNDFDACERALAAVLERQPAADLAAESLFLRGAAQLRQNRSAEAMLTFRRVIDDHVETTWAAKCAMEVEGHGPFTRGFEDFGPLPDRVLRDRDEGSRAPRGTYTEDELWVRGVEFLLRTADADGVVRDSIYDFGGTDSLANVHLAVSFLCGEALLHAAARADSGDLALQQPVRAAIERRLQQLLVAASDDSRFALEDRDEILWAFAYRARFLSQWSAMRTTDKEKGRSVLGPAVAALCSLQPDTGMWFHEYGNAFAVATALQGLAFSKRAGAEIDPAIVARGLAALQKCRTAEGAYSYGDPGKRAARASVAAAAGRMPLCELALVLWNKSSEGELTTALSAAFEHHGLLAAVRKYDDHADRHGYGGFFFWFDMLGRAEATMQLPASAQRELWRAQQKKLVIDLPEFDGCFVDSHELGRSYGTAMAILCLASLRG
ncbi:MAG: tetratricopeptide repeat protein [Planctomycetota bacterium]